LEAMVRGFQCICLYKSRSAQAVTLRDAEAALVVEARLPMLLGALRASPVTRPADEIPFKMTTGILSRTVVPEHSELCEKSVSAYPEGRHCFENGTATAGPVARKAESQRYDNMSVCSTDFQTTLDVTVEDRADGLSSDDEQPRMLAERNREVALATRHRLADRRAFLGSTAKF